MEIKPMSLELSNLEIDFIESQKQMQEDIYRAFHVPSEFFDKLSTKADIATNRAINRVMDLIIGNVKTSEIHLYKLKRLKTLNRSQTLKYLKIRR